MVATGTTECKAVTPRKYIVVTGYGPFGTHSVNPSAEAVKTLPRKIGDYDVVTYQLPVAYKEVTECIEEIYSKDTPPHYAIHVGVALPGTISLERQAHNSGYILPDINEQLPPNGVAVAGGKEVLQTGLDLSTIKNRMHSKGWMTVNESMDPGRFLCSFIFYQSMDRASKTKHSALQQQYTQSLFVHIPPVGSPHSQIELNAMLAVLVNEVVSSLPITTVST
ncbi:Pyroglutamyl-peptidase 1 [Batrachochytrium dendrobatidis]|uniref:Pyroglutamyl-peptidase I n=2 Tax=Batrachochytrium dendrobatidis (strain JEL423) TaxID=403673 RepID=A0A177WX71_BATDL|nr:Pyroglutamyl-peptidase 1 [Batrachochytrium dendrobatidis]KAK5670358.1 Pyroglutamyl-peptidase 1 [Batrachochytrium dendrobatidis]OAJ43970.1 hypothetical protein BDEG_27277 [Batrachochytrium dendrobatidis JEL423]